MSLIFYYSPYSTAGITHFVLEELGMPYEKVRVELQGKGTNTPAFRKLNPNGKVPVVVHDGQAIFESAAITLYLGETFGVEKNLFPPPGLLRSQAMQWIVWSNVTLAEAVNRTNHASSPRSPAERHNAAVAAWGKADVAECLGILDKALAAKPYVLGETFSLVDAHLSSTVGWIGMLGLVPTGLTHLDDWLRRCTSRPAHLRTSGPDA